MWMWNDWQLCRCFELADMNWSTGSRWKVEKWPEGKFVVVETPQTTPVWPIGNKIYLVDRLTHRRGKDEGLERLTCVLYVELYLDELLSCFWRRHVWKCRLVHWQCSFPLWLSTSCPYKMWTIWVRTSLGYFLFWNVWIYFLSEVL